MAGVRIWRDMTYDGLGAWADEFLDGLVPGLLAGREVFLKVNVSTGRPVSAACSTHPAVVEAVGRALLARGARPWVGDSCPVPGLSGEAARACGIVDACRRAAIPFVDLDREAAEPVPLDEGEAVLVARRVLRSAVRLSLPKFKTHPLFLLTGATKNLMGLLPGACKPALHVAAKGRVDELARRLLSLARALPFHGAAVDGIEALGGRGGSRGHVVRAGLLLAGRDLVEVDRAMAVIAGLDEERLPLLRVAGKAVPAAGTEDWPRVDLSPDPSPWEWIPLLARVAYALRRDMIRPLHLPGRCRGCGACEAVCPTGRAAGLRRGAGAGPACLGCMLCTGACPTGAMVARIRPWARRSVRRRTSGLSLEDLGIGKDELHEGPEEPGEPPVEGVEPGGKRR